MFYYHADLFSQPIPQFVICFIETPHHYSNLQYDSSSPAISEAHTSSPSEFTGGRDKASNPYQEGNKGGNCYAETRSGRSAERSDFEGRGQRRQRKAREGCRKAKKGGKEEMVLDFRTEWKNQNRNIIPNIVNQMMSLLLKRSKSQKLIDKLFARLPHPAPWTPNKFYLYMRKMRDSTCHYLDQSALRYFFQIHQPECLIYEADQQQFYMKLSRICMVNFLREDLIMNTLSCLGVSPSKKKSYLVARQALLNKFLELARNNHF